MPYLHVSDYATTIQAPYFQQLVQGDDSKRVQEELSSISICKSRLQQKYDVSLEFTDTSAYSNTTQYYARSRVIIDYPAYSDTSTYAVGEFVVYAAKGYICTEDVSAPETFDISKWRRVGAQFAIYFGSYPTTCTYPATLAEPNAPVFNVLKPYKQGDIVYWKGYTYECMIGSMSIDAQQMIQYYSINNLPYLNVFPDSVVNNQDSQFWGSKTAYEIPLETLPTDTDYWTLGDNREQQIVKAMKNVTIYNLSNLISPKNCPAEWEGRWKLSLQELAMMANGDITVDIPLLQPPSGRRIRYGGFVKNPNLY